MSTPTPTGRTAGQTFLLALGAVILLAGLVCVVLGFGSFAKSAADPAADSAADGGGALALFAGGGLAMVVGLGIVAFTRVSVMRSGGAYTRVTIEQGAAPAGGRFCPSCGHPSSRTARFCDSCGTALG